MIKKYFRSACLLATPSLLAAAIFITPFASPIFSVASVAHADATTATPAAPSTTAAPTTPSTAPTSTPPTCGTDSTICNPIGGGKVNDLPALIVLIIKYLIALVGMVAVLMIIIGGYQMVTSVGNEETYKKAKHTITYAIVGLVLAVLSYSIAAIIETSLGANLSAPASSSVSSSSSTSGTPSQSSSGSTGSTGSTGSSGTSNSSGSTGLTGNSNSSNNTNQNNSNSSQSNGSNQSATNPTGTSSPASSPTASSNCTAAAMEGINISAPSSAVIDPSSGGSIQYKITPDNDVAANCQVTINTYILEGSDPWSPSLQPNSTASAFGVSYTLGIPEKYSQDPSIWIYSRFTDSTGAVKDDYAQLNLSETPQNDNGTDSSGTIDNGSNDGGGDE